jgi:phenylalanyl-tRNA synthetase beta chain
MRSTMLISALEVVSYNQNRQNSDLTLFEFGKTYQKFETGYNESKELVLVQTGNKYDENWLVKQNIKSNFYSLKASVEKILKYLNIVQYSTTETENAEFDFGIKYKKGKIGLVEIGKVSTKYCKYFDIKNEVFYANFNWDNLLKVRVKRDMIVKEISKFPTVRRDLALILEKNIKFEQIVEVTQKTLGEQLVEINLFDVFEDETKLGKGKKSYAISLMLENKEKTLTEKEIEHSMTKLIQQLENRLEANIRKQ